MASKKFKDRFMKERSESSTPSPATQTSTSSRPDILLQTSITGSKPFKTNQPFPTSYINKSFGTSLQSSVNVTPQQISTTKRSYADSTSNNKGAMCSSRPKAQHTSSSSESEDLPQGPFSEDSQYSSLNSTAHAATIQPQFVIDNVSTQPFLSNTPLAQFHHQAVGHRPVLSQGQGFVYIMQPVQTLTAQTLPADQRIIQTLQVPL